MARFNGVAESATALGTGINSASVTTGGLFAALVLTGSSSFRVRRLTLGVRAGTGAPTSQQVSVAAIRCTARGTQTSSQALNKLDPNSFATNVALDIAWSTTPTLAGTGVANYSFEVSFNTQSGVDLPWELLEELYTSGASGNGIAFFNIGNALPTSHLYTFACEIEELQALWPAGTRVPAFPCPSCAFNYRLSNEVAPCPCNIGKACRTRVPRGRRAPAPRWSPRRPSPSALRGRAAPGMTR